MTRVPPVTSSDSALIKGSVLIVDDNETARKQLQTLLAADAALAVETATNGSEALQKLAEQRFSVVITDLKMPRVSGLERLEEIQKRGLPSAVIVTTGVGGVEEAVRAMQL